MRTTILAFFLGIVLLQQLPELPVLPWGRLCLALLPLLLIPQPVLRLTAALALGFTWAAFRADIILSQSLPPELEKRDVTVEGTVRDIPRDTPEQLRFSFQVHTLTFAGKHYPSPGAIQLNWYTRNEAQRQQATALQPGQRWRFTVRLKRPHGFHNPGGFDYSRWLFAHGIRAVGYVRGDRELIAKAPLLSVQAWRYHLWQDLHRQVGNSPLSGIVAALALGERQGISDAQWAVLRKTGTNHLMAISGLHIGWAAVLGFFAGRLLMRYFMVWLIRIPKQLFASLFGIAAAGVYAVLAGGAIPTQRAFIMVGTVLLGMWFYRRVPVSHLLLPALLAVLLWSPLAVLSAGFWLSFGAVAVIMYALGARPHLTQAWARIHVIVAIGLAPLLLLWFNQVPWLSPVANLVAVPWMGLMVPLVLGGTLLLPLWPDAAQGLLTLGSEGIALLWYVLEHLAQIPGAHWQQPPAPLWTIFCALIGTAILLLPRGLPGRWIGLLWMLPALWFPRPQPAPGQIWFTLLDVGQGLAAVVRTREHTLLYDTGPRFSERFDAAQGIVVPFLHSQGIFHLDRLIISHDDLDHAGGTRRLIEQTPVTVDKVLAGMPEALPDAKACMDASPWEWDGVRFEVFHPPPSADYYRDNNRSCVLKVSTGAHALLLTGDIEAAVEYRLVTEVGQRLKADVLVVPHHGSASSSSAAFIAAVQPRYALFASGYLNHFGFPKPQVVARYRAQGAQTLNSSEWGAIHLKLSPQGPSEPESSRQQMRRYWHTRMNAQR